MPRRMSWICDTLQSHWHLHSVSVCIWSLVIQVQFISFSLLQRTGSKKWFSDSFTSSCDLWHPYVVYYMLIKLMLLTRVIFVIYIYKNQWKVVVCLNKLMFTKKENSGAVTFIVVRRIFTTKSIIFNWNPCKLEFHMKAKDFTTQISQWSQNCSVDQYRAAWFESNRQTIDNRKRLQNFDKMSPMWLHHHVCWQKKL